MSSKQSITIGKWFSFQTLMEKGQATINFLFRYYMVTWKYFNSPFPTSKLEISVLNF